MFRTLYSKLAVTLAVLFLGLGLLFLMLMRSSFDVQRLAVEQELNRVLAERLVAEFFATARSQPESDYALFDTMMRINPNIELYRLDAAGKLLTYSVPEGKMVRETVDLAPIRRFLAGDSFPLTGDDPRDARRRKIFSAAPIGEAGYLYVILGGEMRDSIMMSLSRNQAFRSAAWLTGIALAIALFAGFVAFSFFTMRLSRLQEAILRFRESGFGQRVPYVGTQRGRRPDEIDQLGETYNQMAERIIAQLQELHGNDAMRRDLIANISHDLRTPLASLRGYLDTLLLKGDSISERERRYYLEVAAKQAERLGSLVAQFFELAKLDGDDVTINAERFMIEELAQDVLQQFELQAKSKGVRLSVDVASDGHFVEADIGLVERVLSNLVSNAVRHTTSGDTVTISARLAGARVEVSVADTGSGIPREALEHIFERSFTLEKSRSGSRDGSGLGLAIVKRIVELHDGDVHVESTYGEGARFVFDLAAAGQTRIARVA